MFCEFRWLTQREIVIGIAAGKHLWHALGRGDQKVGNGTGVHAERRRWRPANFAGVGLMTTSRPKMSGPGFRKPRHRRRWHAVPFHRSTRILIPALRKKGVKGLEDDDVLKAQAMPFPKRGRGQ